MVERLPEPLQQQVLEYAQRLSQNVPLRGFHWQSLRNMQGCSVQKTPMQSCRLSKQDVNR